MRKGVEPCPYRDYPPGTLLREGYVAAIQTPPHRSPLVLGNSWYGWIKFRNKRQDDQDEINHRDTSDFFVFLRARPLEPSAPPVYFPAWSPPQTSKVSTAVSPIEKAGNVAIFQPCHSLPLVQETLKTVGPRCRIEHFDGDQL